MKKFMIILAGAGVLFAGAANAAQLSQGTTTTVQATSCALLSEDVDINLSKLVFGSYACNITDNIMGVATGHPNGRGFIYAGSSDGGAVAATSSTAGDAPTASTVDSAATTASSGS